MDIGSSGVVDGGAVVGATPERVARVRTEGAIHHGGVLSPMARLVHHQRLSPSIPRGCRKL